MNTSGIKDEHFDKAVLIMSVLYILFSGLFLIYHHVIFTLVQIIILILLAFFLYTTGSKNPLLDWKPFVLIYMGYEFLRGVTPVIRPHINIFPMIHLDEIIFGFIPDIKLQSLFYTPHNLHWYDYFAVSLYLGHFIIPLIVGIFIWKGSRKFFKEYAFGLLFLSYISYVTYLLYPAMPPWMAAEHGYIPYLHDIITAVTANFIDPANIPAIFGAVGADLIAAMPSLHAAFPFYIFLFAINKFRRKAILLIPYILAVWLTVLYLGQHYFTDILAGVFYATFSYAVTSKIFPLLLIKTRSVYRLIKNSENDLEV